MHVHLKVKLQGFDQWRKWASKFRIQMGMLKNRLGLFGVRAIQAEILKRNLIDTGQMRMSADFKTMKDGLLLTVGAEYSEYLNRGIRKHVMKYLKKSNRRIVHWESKKLVRTKTKVYNTNEDVFRTISDKSMKKSRPGDGLKYWTHKGFTRGQGFFDKAVQRTYRHAMKEMITLTEQVFK